MAEEYPPRIEVPCNTCRGIVGLEPTCPDCYGYGTMRKRNSPSEPWKYADDDPPCFRPGFDKEDYERKAAATRGAAAAIRDQSEYPVDHILQGEAELRGRRYTGDEAEFVEDEPPRPVLRPLPPVEAVDEIESRNLAAYVAGEERDFPPLGPPIGQVACCTGPAGWSWSNYTPPAGTPYTPLKRPGQKSSDPIHPTSRKYIDLLDKLRDLHLSKSADYGTTDDPLANIRNGAAFVGIEPWRACLVRLSDKVTRIGTYCAKGTLTHEGVEDSLLDLAAYSLLTLLLHQEPASSTPPLPPAGTGDD